MMLSHATSWYDACGSAKGTPLDEMEMESNDPIADALAAVDKQYADRLGSPVDASTLDADSDEDGDVAANDLEASETDDTDDTVDASDDETTEELSWDNPEHPYHAYYLQAQAAEERAAEADQRRAQAQDLINRALIAKTQKEVNALFTDLNDLDPDIASRVQQHTAQLAGRVQAGQQESLGYQHGMAALHLAMVDVLGEEQANAVVERGRELSQKRDLDEMQQTVQSRHAKSERETALERQVKALQLQVAAKRRDPNAEKVDSSPARHRRPATTPETAETMDQFWDSWEGNPFK